MRSLTLALVLCTTAPTALFADTLITSSRVARVTLYPWGASVVRIVELSAPAGVHELIVPDLPLDTDSGSLRVAGEGISIGAVNLQYDRLPVTETTPDPAIAAAEAEVERLEGVVRDNEAAIAAIRLRVDAANRQVAFLSKLGQGEGSTAEDLRALSRMVAEEVLAASQAAFAADQEAMEAERAAIADLDALDDARQALAALTDSGEDFAALVAAVEIGTSGTGTVEITTFTDAANWQPVYDLRLTRVGAAKPSLSLERGVLVSQYSGEDWRGVDLVLSTARPSDQSEPSRVNAWLRRIGPPEPPMVALSAPRFEAKGLFDSYAEEPSPVVETAALEMMGATVTYRYGAPVDIRDGVDALRLRLDTLTLAPEVVAEAVPLLDETAFLVAKALNDSGQVLLPGEATLYLDGAMVGLANLPLTAAGADLRLGFGPIDGLVLTRTVPTKTEGDRGLISKTNQQNETAVLTIENLTEEAWALRVLDRVPYSEQEDLVITYKATPAATFTDLDGKRGVLAWQSTLAPGKTQTIRLESTISWPIDQVLR
ncbi:DUF4139 domain-containing protein [Phaeovulum sp.]|uniref:DUF4139 domain-containing protein n=1 Tax=Phaeovulum sp. TaxID=2934796 RepID=UPI0027318AB7|nr:DUF4139 domain-containing protein [Phaeovulum sp.]MDP1668838.1 DUF4139 domain-containing protein [Phaeovulum sp.]MDP2061499.1 DUF4139 domain-containing protein [Phaeovulum sp.]MDZ4117888.1 DUF4139 domain-containing protein [Phaeovulum sp.]